jgi:hypothetical protein
MRRLTYFNASITPLIVIMLVSVKYDLSKLPTVGSFLLYSLTITHFLAVTILCSEQEASAKQNWKPDVQQAYTLGLSDSPEIRSKLAEYRKEHPKDSIQN